MASLGSLGSLLKGAVRATSSTSLWSLRTTVRCLSSNLPSNLKLADPSILARPPARPLQELKEDPLRSVRDRTAGGAKAVFQRAGTSGAPVVVPVEAFARPPGADPDAPPPPPTTMSLSAKVFGQPLRLDILQTVVKWQLACRRRGTAHTKRIGDVSGSGKKMRPQKGGGTARAGHKRPPHWKGGAKAHGPRNTRVWAYKLNKKEKRLGLCVALSAKAAEGNLHVVDGVAQSSHKTGALARLLKERGWGDAVFLTEGASADVRKAKAQAVRVEASAGAVVDLATANDTCTAADAARARAAAWQARGEALFLVAAHNLPLVHALPARRANVYALLRREKVVLTAAAVRQLERRLTAPVRRKPWEPKLADPDAYAAEEGEDGEEGVTTAAAAARLEELLRRRTAEDAKVNMMFKEAQN